MSDQTLFLGRDRNALIKLAITVILPLFIFFLIAQKQVLEGVTAGSVKG